MQKFWITNKLNDQTAEILVYGYIGDDDCGVMAADFVKELVSLEKQYPKINIRINSGGGSVYEGFAIFNAIRRSKSHIVCYVDGLAASMGTVIALAGKKLYMSKHARFMTHQASGFGMGSADSLRQQAELLDGLNNTVCSIYAAKTGLTTEECRKRYLNSIDNWFDAQQALSEKLIDGVYDGDKVDIPATAKDEKEICDIYSNTFAASYNQKETSMKQIQLSAPVLAAMKLPDTADQTAFEAKITEMATMAAKVTQLETAVTTANTEKKNAEDALAALQVNTADEKLETIISSAVADKKMTVEMSNILRVQYKGKTDDLKALVATMKPFESLTDKLFDTKEVDQVELASLIKLTGEELFQQGKMERLKELSAPHFKMKYKEYFESDPPEDKK